LTSNEPRFNSADFLSEQLEVQGWKKAEFARRIGKKANSIDIWFRQPNPARPEWDIVDAIARVFSLEFDYVADHLGYPRPQAPPPQPLDSWELASRRRSRELLNILLRTPSPSRLVVGDTADFAIGMLGRQVDSLIAGDEST
jgi:hypothetical protein